MFLKETVNSIFQVELITGLGIFLLYTAIWLSMQICKFHAMKLEPKGIERAQ